jgi:hypothetical protein
MYYDPNPPDLDPTFTVDGPVLSGPPSPTGPVVTTMQTCSRRRPLVPGTTYADITVPDGRHCTLPDGLYRITGNVHVGTNASFVGNDVTLYFDCSTGPAGCGAPGPGPGPGPTPAAPPRLDAGPGSTVSITGWDVSGWNTGHVTVFVPDDNTAGLKLAKGSFAGTIYAPGSLFQVEGGPGGQVVSADRVVAKQLDVKNGELDVSQPVDTPAPTGFTLSK